MTAVRPRPRPEAVRQVVCVPCEGTGLHHVYSREWFAWMPTSANCPTCDGRGWIEVEVECSEERRQ